MATVCEDREQKVGVLSLEHGEQLAIRCICRRRVSKINNLR